MEAPWKVEPSSINQETNAPFCYYIIEGGKIIATTWVNHDDKQTRQHAHIMAAAPVLYEAVKQAVEVFRSYEMHHANKGDLAKAEFNSRYGQIMHEALLKADGGAE